MIWWIWVLDMASLRINFDSKLNILWLEFRLKNLKSQVVGVDIHPYRGATIIGLIDIAAQYPVDINSVTLFAGFNDHRGLVEIFVNNYKFLIDLIIIFRPYL